MIFPKKIKAGDLFKHENKKTYFCLGKKIECVNTGMPCRHFEDVGLPDVHIEPCREYLYAFLIDGRFCWVLLKHKEWLAQFKKVI